MKKLLFLLLLVAAAYGAYKYMEAVQQKTATRQDALKPSEKALKDIDKDTGK